MEHALWNGKSFLASDVAKSYELEKQVRKASGYKELTCPDPDCPSPILRYCHGEVKRPFFAHLNNCKCDYAEYDKENTYLTHTIKHALYEHFHKLGYDVQLEAKVLPHHYTHLLFTINDRKIALELGRQQTTANQTDYLAEQYQKAGIEICWLVIDNAQVPVRESETFFIKRYLLNESKHKDLLVIDWNCNDLMQCVWDPNIYEYRGRPLYSDNYPEVYSEKVSLKDLAYENGAFSITGFHSRYQAWLVAKKRAFQKKITELEKERLEQEKLRKQQIEKEKQQARTQYRFTQSPTPITPPAKKTTTSSQITISTNQETAPPKPNKPLSLSYEERRQSILSYIDQPRVQARDITGTRWLKCERCGCIDTDANFAVYGGGTDYWNWGVCNTCDRKRKIVLSKK